MPKLSIEEALRHFGAPFVLFFYFALYDSRKADDLIRTFGVTGLAAGFVTGSIIYLLYRYLIYDFVIDWLHDIFRNDTLRRYLGRRYQIAKTKTWLPSDTAKATKLVRQLFYRDERLRDPWFRLRASRIHFLYQSGLLALPFVVLTVAQGSSWRILFFLAAAVVLLFTAVIADVNHEDEEFMIIKSIPRTKMDKAARDLKLKKRG